MSIITTTDAIRPAPDVARRTAQRRTAGVSWLPWADTGPVATPSFERTFVSELADAAGGASDPHVRRDTTALLNALRGGLSPAALFERTPGLRPGCLYGAYLELDDRRERSANAWLTIMERPTIDVLAEQYIPASRLMPVLVERMIDAARIDPQILPRLAGNIAIAVEETSRAVQNIELELDRCTDPDRKLTISRTLYDPIADCVFGRDEHMPTRVGSLVPTRVASLLGERDAPRMLPEAS